MRLTNAGYKIYHDNKIVVFHFAAKNSGSRSTTLGPVWVYSNICYLHLKHFYKEDHKSFYKKAMFFLVSPSKLYFKPLRFLQDLLNFKKGYQIAKKRIENNPIYINM